MLFWDSESLRRQTRSRGPFPNWQPYVVGTISKNSFSDCLFFFFFITSLLSFQASLSYRVSIHLNTPQFMMTVTILNSLMSEQLPGEGDITDPDHPGEASGTAERAYKFGFRF